MRKVHFVFVEGILLLFSGGLGTMGYGLPAAVGVQVAHPDSLVIDIAGEASVLMTMQEMSTAAQYALPIKIFILNNEYMGMVRQWQELLPGGRYSHSYTAALPDFVKLAEAYQGVGIRAEKPSELDDAIREMIAVKKPVIFDCRVDKHANCFPMIPSGEVHNNMLMGDDLTVEDIEKSHHRRRQGDGLALGDNTVIRFLLSLRAIMLVSDHFFGPPQGREVPSHDAWTTLALLVPQTKRIRLGTLCTSQSYRNPAHLAKIVATLDNASNGRIDLGIGAGWKETEYKAYGYPFPTAKERVTQLQEAIQIINLLWTQNKPSFNGNYYKIKETMFLPKPVQKPRVPIWIGSIKLKAPMIEETVARYADGMDYGEETTIKNLLEKKERVERMCEKVGRDFKSLRWSVSETVGVIGEDTDDAKAEAEAKRLADEKAKLEADLDKIRQQRAQEREALAVKRSAAAQAETAKTPAAEQKSMVDKLVENLNWVHRRNR